MDCHGIFAQQQAQKDFVFQMFKAYPRTSATAAAVPGIFDPPRPAALR
jgi:hypothetical protein